jgi:hypothetical protein
MKAIRHTGITWALTGRAWRAWALADLGRAVERAGERWLGQTDRLAERYGIAPDAVLRPLKR